VALADEKKQEPAVPKGPVRTATPPIVKDAEREVLLGDYVRLIAAGEKVASSGAMIKELKNTCAVTNIKVFSGSYSVQSCYSATATPASYKSCCAKHLEQVKDEAGMALEIIKGNLTTPLKARIKRTMEAMRAARIGYDDTNPDHTINEGRKIEPVTDEDIKVFFEEVKKKMQSGKVPGDKAARGWEQYYKDVLEKGIAENEKQLTNVSAKLAVYEKKVREACNKMRAAYDEKKKDVACFTPDDIREKVAEKRNEALANAKYTSEAAFEADIQKYYLCVMQKSTEGICKSFNQEEQKRIETAFYGLQAAGFCNLPPEDPIVCGSGDDGVEPEYEPLNVVVTKEGNDLNMVFPDDPLIMNPIEGKSGDKGKVDNPNGGGQGQQGQGDGGGGQGNANQGAKNGGGGQGKGQGKGGAQNKGNASVDGNILEQVGGEGSGGEMSCVFTKEDQKKVSLATGVQKPLCDKKKMCAKTQKLADKFGVKLCDPKDRVCVYKRKANDTSTPLCTGNAGSIAGTCDPSKQTCGGGGKGAGAEGDGGDSRDGKDTEGEGKKCPARLKAQRLCSNTRGRGGMRGQNLVNNLLDPCHKEMCPTGTCPPPEVAPELSSGVEGLKKGLDKQDAVKETARFLLRNLIMSARDQMMRIRFRKGSYNSVDEARQDNMSYYLEGIEGACKDDYELKSEAEKMVGPLRQEAIKSNYFKDASDQALKKAAQDLGPLKAIIGQLADTAADFPEEYVNFDSMFLDLVPCGVVIKGAINLVKSEMQQYKNRQKSCTEFPKYGNPSESERLSCDQINSRVMEMAAGKLTNLGHEKLEVGVNIDSSELNFHEYAKVINEKTTEIEKVQGEIDGLQEGSKTLASMAGMLHAEYVSYLSMGGVSLPKGTNYPSYEYDSTTGGVKKSMLSAPKAVKASELAQIYLSTETQINALVADLNSQVEPKKIILKSYQKTLEDARAEVKKLQGNYSKVMPGISHNGKELVPPSAVSPKEPKILQCHRKCQRMHALLAQKARILNENPDLARRLQKDKSVWESMGEFFASTPPKSDENKLFTSINNDNPEATEQILDKVLSQTDTAFNNKDHNMSLESKSHNVIHDIKYQISSLCKDPEKFVKAALTNSKMKALMSDCSLQADGMPHYEIKGKDVWKSYNEEWQKSCDKVAKNQDIQYFICNNVMKSEQSEKLNKDIQTALQVGGDMADVAGCALMVGKGVAIGARVVRAGVALGLRAGAKYGVRTAIAVGIKKGARVALKAETSEGLKVATSVVTKAGLANMGLNLLQVGNMHFGVLSPERHEYCNKMAQSGLAQGHFNLIPEEDKEECKAHTESLVQFTRMMLLSYATGKFDEAAMGALGKMAGGNHHSSAHYERSLMARYEKLSVEEKAHIEKLSGHQQSEMKKQIIAQLAGDEFKIVDLQKKSLSDLIDLYNAREAAKYKQQALGPVGNVMAQNDASLGSGPSLPIKTREALTATELLHLEKYEREHRIALDEIESDIGRLEKIPENKRTANEKALLKKLQSLKKEMGQQRAAFYKELAGMKKGCS